MTDIVERLREMATYECQFHTVHAPAVMSTAADEIERLREENERLSKDAERLVFAMSDIDGFAGVEGDKYDHAMNVCREAGREEPTAEDELNGIRRLIDAAMREYNIAAWNRRHDGEKK